MAVAELDRESLAKVKEESFSRIIWNRFRKAQAGGGQYVPPYHNSPGMHICLGDCPL